MENKELLQAMKAMIEPMQKDIADIKEHTTRIEEHISHIEDRITHIEDCTARIEERTTRTETLIENDITKKLNLLGEGQLGMNEKFRQLDKLTNKVEDIQTTV